MITDNPTKEQFESAIAKGKTLVDFWASWCGPCRAQAPIAERLEKETEVDLVRVDVDACGELASEFGISSIPTLMLYSNGELVKRFIGLTPLDDLKAAFGL